MSHRYFAPAHLAAAFAALAIGTAASAAPVRVKVTTENLAPSNSISFAPLHVGFNNGTFDAFNNGQTATAGIISVAEGGGGMAWQADFALADPTATRGTIAGPLQPGDIRSRTFTVDTSINQFFTFAAMAVPSNDSFIGNDSPTRFHLFDAAGNLLINSIGQKASDIWDAGSEVFDPLNAAFLVVGNNDLRIEEHGVVSFNFSQLAGFNGLTTATGYVFNSQLAAATDIYRISFEIVPVPEPQTYALTMAGLVATGWIARRRRVKPGATVA